MLEQNPTTPACRMHKYEIAGMHLVGMSYQFPVLPLVKLWTRPGDWCG